MNITTISDISAAKGGALPKASKVPKVLVAVWPEGLPSEAVMCVGWWSMQWHMVGPKGWWAMLRGRRMSKAWPCRADDDPVAVARRCEHNIRMRRGRA